MMRLILSNRWLALFWVCGVLASISAFAGKGGKIEQAVNQVQQKAQVQNQQLQAQGDPHVIVIDESAADQNARNDPPLGEGIDPNPEAQVSE